MAATTNTQQIGLTNFEKNLLAPANLSNGLQIDYKPVDSFKLTQADAPNTSQQNLNLTNTFLARNDAVFNAQQSNITNQINLQSQALVQSARDAQSNQLQFYGQGGALGPEDSTRNLSNLTNTGTRLNQELRNINNQGLLAINQNFANYANSNAQAFQVVRQADFQDRQQNFSETLNLRQQQYSEDMGVTDRIGVLVQNGKEQVREVNGRQIPIETLTKKTFDANNTGYYLGDQGKLVTTLGAIKFNEDVVSSRLTNAVKFQTATGYTPDFTGITNIYKGYNPTITDGNQTDAGLQTDYNKIKLNDAIKNGIPQIENLLSIEKFKEAKLTNELNATKIAEAKQSIDQQATQNTSVANLSAKFEEINNPTTTPARKMELNKELESEWGAGTGLYHSAKPRINKDGTTSYELIDKYTGTNYADGIDEVKAVSDMKKVLASTGAYLDSNLFDVNNSDKEYVKQVGNFKKVYTKAIQDMLVGEDTNALNKTYFDYLEEGKLKSVISYSTTKSEGDTSSRDVKTVSVDMTSLSETERSEFNNLLRGLKPDGTTDPESTKETKSKTLTDLDRFLTNKKQQGFVKDITGTQAIKLYNTFVGRQDETLKNTFLATMASVSTQNGSGTEDKSEVSKSLIGLTLAGTSPDFKDYENQKNKIRGEYQSPTGGISMVNTQISQLLDIYTKDANQTTGFDRNKIIENYYKNKDIAKNLENKNLGYSKSPLFDFASNLGQYYANAGVDTRYSVAKGIVQTTFGEKDDAKANQLTDSLLNLAMLSNFKLIIGSDQYATGAIYRSADNQGFGGNIFSSNFKKTI